jgi:TPR repeat protein
MLSLGVRAVISNRMTEGTVCSGCATALVASDVLYGPDARPLCADCFAKVDLRATERRGQRFGVIATGGVVGLVPFAVSMSEASWSTVNGVVEHATYRDWFAVVGGVAAAMLALFGLATSARRAGSIGLGCAVVALGALQIARGFGVFWSPPAESTSSIEGSSTAPPSDDPATCADADACFQIGERLHDAKDFAPALVAYMRACERGGAGGCNNAARLYVDGHGTAKDDARASQLFARACDLKGSYACWTLALRYSEGLGVAADHAKAVELAVRACDLDSTRELAKACDAAGEDLYNGSGVAADPARAAQYFAKACERADKHCLNLGIVTSDGKGIVADLAHGRALYQRACDAGVAGACYNLGIDLRKGIGGAADLPAARAAYKTGCDGGDASACTNLGALLAHGLGGAKDRDGAKALYKQACDAGEQLGCDNLKSLK